MKRLRINSSGPDFPDMGSNMLEHVTIPVLFVQEVLSGTSLSSAGDPLNLAMSTFLSYGRKWKAVTRNHGVPGKGSSLSLLPLPLSEQKPVTNLFHPCYILLEIPPKPPKAAQENLAAAT